MTLLGPSDGPLSGARPDFASKRQSVARGGHRSGL